MSRSRFRDRAKGGIDRAIVRWRTCVASSKSRHYWGLTLGKVDCQLHSSVPKQRTRFGLCRDCAILSPVAALPCRRAVHG